MWAGPVASQCLASTRLALILYTYTSPREHHASPPFCPLHVGVNSVGQLLIRMYSSGVSPWAPRFARTSSGRMGRSAGASVDACGPPPRGGSGRGTDQDGEADSQGTQPGQARDSHAQGALANAGGACPQVEVEALHPRRCPLRFCHPLHGVAWGAHAHPDAVQLHSSTVVRVGSVPTA